MKNIILISLLTGLTLGACSQQSGRNTTAETDRSVGARCEGCEAIHESPVAFSELNEVDTLPDFNEQGPKIEISGIIYKNDGKTPAPGVVLYIYHTDQQGNYSRKEKDPLSNTTWGKRHGYNRGWIKTNEKGEYRFYTLVPASYPNSNNPKHIHPTIKEPGLTAYWIDEYVFADDPLLPEAEKTRTRPVGGSGLLQTTMKDGMLRARRDIILGLNVEGYK